MPVTYLPLWPGVLCQCSDSKNLLIQKRLYSPCPWAPATCTSIHLSYYGAAWWCCPFSPIRSFGMYRPKGGKAPPAGCLPWRRLVLPMGVQSCQWAASRAWCSGVLHLYIHLRYLVRPRLEGWVYWYEVMRTVILAPAQK